MPSRLITLVNYPPSPKQKNLFCELTGYKLFPISSITTRQGCHLAIKAMIDGRAAGKQLAEIEFPRQVFAKEWNKDYTVKDYGTAQGMSALKLATLNDITVVPPTATAVKKKLVKLNEATSGVKAPVPEAQAADAFDGIISVSRRGQIS